MMLTEMVSKLHKLGKGRTRKKAQLLEKYGYKLIDKDEYRMLYFNKQNGSLYELKYNGKWKKTQR
ncbi:MAG: hypothetical protein GTO02_16870 [Candidatus Dadabacteria bacterium]|nr:hypothetical protein [Candidatus Dadabacteria bacterium]